MRNLIASRIASAHAFSLAVLFVVGLTVWQMPESVSEEQPTVRSQERPSSTPSPDRVRAAAADAKNDSTKNKSIDPVKAAQEKRAQEAARARGEITFDDLKFDIEKDGVFEEGMITDSIHELDAKVVRLRGFILPSFLFQQKGFTRFVLVRDNQECCFGPGAALYDCVMVEMEPGKTADFETRLVTIKGKFATDTKSYRYPDGEPYAVFKIVASEVR